MEAESHLHANPGDSHSFLLRWLIIGAILSAAVAAGIYSGYALSGKTASARPDSLATTSFLKIGDEFPDYELWDAQLNLTTTVRHVTGGGSTLMAFVSKDCGACWSLVEYWGEKVVPQSDPGIRVLRVFDAADRPLPDPRRDQLHLPRSRIVTTHRSTQKAIDGIDLTPTVIGLDENSKTRPSQRGGERRKVS